MDTRDVNASRREFLRNAGLLTASAMIVSQFAGACTSAPGTASMPKGETDAAAYDASQLKAFVPSDKVGTKPNLPRRVAWANTSDAEFFLAITKALEQATKDRGLEFITAIANDDSAKNVEQINTFLQRGIAALCIQPLDANAQRPLMQKALDQGIAVLSLVTPPCTLQCAARQYDVGYAQGAAAAKWITENLGGKAKVVHFHHDYIEVLKERHRGTIEAVKAAGPDVEIVVDVSPGNKITKEAGFEAMNTVLQAHPDVNVVLSADTISLGALAAMEAAGKATDQVYISGINGDQEALDAIRKGGAYKASFAFAYPMMGYAWGQYAADWLDGKEIPRLLLFKPIELNSPATIDEFETAMKNVKDNWKSVDKYFTPMGNISFDTWYNYLRVAA
jgi:ribose transport system substrate-binding protein